MGSSSKKHKDARKKRHRSRSASAERESPKEKKHRHRRHHKDRKREKVQKHLEYESDDSDVVEISSSREVTPPPSNSDSPEPSGQSADSLSIQETNKLRAKLGLKPLELRGETAKDGKKKDDLGEFYHKPATNISDKQKQEKLKAKLAEHKEKRALENKLTKVRTLGESDSEDDISSWVGKSRKLENAKRDAEKRAKVLEELDAQFGVGDIIEEEQRQKKRQKYTEKSLQGLKVDHDVDTFHEGKSVILTLKDAQVLGEDEDVLVNVNMLDDERYKKSNDNKKKKDVYNAYEDDEFDEFGNPRTKSLLGKYDEEIEGVRSDSFKIGHDNAAERKQAIIQSIKDKLNTKRLESLATNELNLASDYYSETELAKFKKPKKKGRKMRAKGKIMTADDLEEVARTGDHKSIKMLKDEDMSIDDVPDYHASTSYIKLEEKDDALERALHKARKLKQREQVVVELISTTVANIKPEEQMEENLDPACNIVLNATAEFCRTLGDIPTYGRAGNREEGEDLLDYEKEAKDEYPVSEDDDLEMMDEGGRWNVVNLNEKKEVPITTSEVPILEAEPDVGSGVSAALKLAMSKGYLDKEQNNRPSNTRLAHLQAKHYSIEDKSYGGDEGDRGRRERYSGPIQEFRERDGFKPNVKLEYIDDDGHVLNSKEAFRYLSHKFHGKGPGKNKVEKRIKKNQQEGLMKKMSSTDTPLGTLNMLQAKQKELQSPYIVLSGSKHTHSTIISKARR